jgi:hypothetical protein
MRHERASREERREKQHAQDVALGRELERMNTNIQNLQRQVDHDRNR